MPLSGKKYGFDDLIDVKGFKKGLAELERQFNELHKTIKTNQSINSKNLGGEDLKKIIAGIEDVNKAQRSRIKTTNDLGKAEKERAKEAQKIAKEREKVEKEAIKRLERLRKQKDKNNVTENQANTAIKKTIKSENDRIKVVGVLTKRLKSLDQTTEKGRKEYEKINKELAKHNKLLRQAGKARNDDRRNVGNYTSALGKLKGGLMNVGSTIAGGLGLAGGVMALTSVMKQAIGITIEFDKALSKY